MAYTHTWDETQPLGTAAANTIDDVIRALKQDVRERLNDALGITTYATDDPVRIGTLRFTGTIIPPATGFKVRNNADSADNLVVTDAGALTARTTITATSGFSGTLLTAAQPNVTSVGTLTSLAVSGNQTIGGTLGVTGAATFSGGIAGTLTTAAQGNITSVGTLTSLTVSGAINAASLTTTGNVSAANVSASANLGGTLTTAAQPNITSLGTLTSLNVTGSVNIGGSAIIVTSIELGSQTVAGSFYMDFHSDGTSLDYNARIIRNTGVNGTLDIINVGNGDITLATNGTNRFGLTVAGHLIPAANNSYDLGSSSNKLRSIYIGTSSTVERLIGASATLNIDSDTIVLRNTAGSTTNLTVNATNTTFNSPLKLGSSTGGKVIVDATNGVLFRDSTDASTLITILPGGVLSLSSNIGIGGNIAFGAQLDALICMGQNNLKIRDWLNTGNIMTLSNASILDLIGASRAIRMNGTQVVTNRQTGWATPTGSAVSSKGSFDVSTVTLAQLAQQVAWLLADLTTHGLIGA